MSSFYKQQLYFNQIVSKRAKITISFFIKNSKSDNIILGFSFMYLVSFYPINGTKVTKMPKTKRRKYGMNETIVLFVLTWASG